MNGYRTVADAPVAFEHTVLMGATENTNAANRYRASILVPRVTKRWRYLRFRVSVASGNIDVGLARGPDTFAASHNFTHKDNLIWRSGIVACPSAGNADFDMTDVLLEAGRSYAVLIWADNTVFAFRGADGVGGLSYVSSNDAVTGLALASSALPSAVVAPSGIIYGDPA